ncbi:MAG: HAD family phosphatase [Oscillospiraceae bacterium]|nr:HAD family phosphatase [Oscillospiraceae bacterium]
MIKAVVFDMDGLLLDTEKLLIKFWIQAANEAGFPLTRENALTLRSLHRSFAVPYLKELFGDSFDYTKIRSRRMELMSGYLAENPLELKNGAVELLEFLRGENIPAAVCTATDYERAAEYLKRAGIFDHFERIICATMVEKGKPQPDIYLYAAKELGLKPSECIALEDSPNGVRSAASAGFITVMVPDLTEPDEELSKIIFARADSLNEVIDIIKGI